MSAIRQRLADGRWHFQHGPIDCIVAADGDAEVVAACTEQAWRRFATILDELVAEQPLLRLDLSSVHGRKASARGRVARRMLAACRPHATGGRFITAMAAVAGSVAEELIDCFAVPGIERAFVNNGGDIALHFAPGAAYAIGVVADPESALAGLALAGRLRIDAESGVRGVATSGWRGRSFSLGIADAATVLAASASAADAAATVLGNAVDVEDVGIVRRPASSLRDGSDLGERLVTFAVAALPAASVEQALAAGAAAARAERGEGRIIAAVLCLQGRHVVIDGTLPLAAPRRGAGVAGAPALDDRDAAGADRAAHAGRDHVADRILATMMPALAAAEC